MSELTEFQIRLGCMFRDESLLRLALTHPSVAHEAGPQTPVGDEAQRRPAHNQRLEFLGDAVLQLVLTRELYEKFPAFDEGPLTKARAKLVNRRTLGEHARVLGLGAHMILSRGEEMHGGRERVSALADTFEALLGAIFLDGGYEVAREFILREFGADFGKLNVLPTIENPKGELQELLQARSPEAPEYHVVSTTGPDHDRVFECTVQHEGMELARGSGKSKKAAESDAALAALKKLREESGSKN
jgi:ribonuclease-3